MSIYGAMFSGVSALAANSQALGMISDNISNLNTIGYKHTEARFETLVINSALANKYAPGGVRSQPFQIVERQGLLQSSESQTDIAISGNGMIVVAETAVPAAGDRYLFTRAGQFSIDKDANLVNTGGYYLQGWPTTPLGAYDVDQDGVADTSNPDPTALSNLQPIQVSTLVGAAQPTSTVGLGLNVPATAAVNDTETLTVKIFDSLGVEHNVSLEWEKTVASPATWTLSATDITLASTGAASTGLAFPILVDTAVFNGDGTPASFTPAALAIPAASWTTAAAASSIGFDLGTANQANGVTQFSSSYTLNYINQDGVGFGRFQSIEIEEDGLVTAVFDNGARRAIFRLPIGTFASPGSLIPVTSNAWTESQQAGSLFLNEPGTGAAGSFAPSSLESSTVDLGTEFTTMIITQRAFSASAKVITTADEMLEELVRIKR